MDEPAVRVAVTVRDSDDAAENVAVLLSGPTDAVTDVVRLNDVVAVASKDAVIGDSVSVVVKLRLTEFSSVAVPNEEETVAVRVAVSDSEMSDDQEPL